MLILNQLINDRLIESISIPQSAIVTIGRSPSCDIPIGANLPVVIQRKISRLQATLLFEDGEWTIVDGNGSDRFSSSGIWEGNKQILRKKIEGAIVIFQWQEFDANSAIEDVRFELNFAEAIDEPTEPKGIRHLSSQIAELKTATEQIPIAFSEDTQQITTEIKSQIKAEIDRQFAMIKVDLSRQKEVDARQSADIARVLRQVRLVGMLIAIVLGSSILLTSIRGARNGESNAWMDVVRAGVTIVAGLVLVGKLQDKKR